MKCNIVRDLIPLYIDDCCSEESEAIVKEHIDNCPKCKEFYESMSALSVMPAASTAPSKVNKINDWQASVLQSVLLFLSFAVITLGVALESATPSGIMNGCWAVSLIIPATGLLLSLANWYFVRLYKSRKIFSNCSLFATLGVTACAYIWAVFHYGFNFTNLNQSLVFYFIIGIFLSVVCCVLSKVLSNQYAKMLGKE